VELATKGSNRIEADWWLDFGGWY